MSEGHFQSKTTFVLICVSFTLQFQGFISFLLVEKQNNINKTDDDNAKPNKSNGGDYDWDYYSAGNGGHYLYCSLIAYNALRA